jgi:hypothetical protein
LKIQNQCLAVLLAFGMTATAGAQGVPPPADIRCLIVGMQLSTATDTNQRTGGNMLTIYYFGRLEHYSAKVLEDAIFKESLIIKPAEFESEAGRCGRTLMEKGQVITQIGSNLSRRAQERQQKQSAPSAAPPAAAPSDTPPAK